MTVQAIILAAGEGTRMRSSRPKPLHPICGRPMVMHVLHSLSAVQPAHTVVVVGHGAERVTKKVQEQAPAWANVSFVEQHVQRGTGDAALVGLSGLDGADDPMADYDDDTTVVVLPGDAPLLQPETVDELVATHVANGYAATMITSVFDDPTGYGRIIRSMSKSGQPGRVKAIVEQRDATAEQLAVREVCVSMYAFRRDLLGPALRRLSPDNAQGEYYLTDVIGSLAAMGHQVDTVIAPAAETQGVNDRWQLALAERELRNRTNRRWLLNGVTMLDPRQTFIDVTVNLGRDVTLYPGTMLHGSTVIGDGCEIGPQTRLTDAVVGPGATVQHTVGAECEIGGDAVVGPFAHLPAGSAVHSGQRTGAFYTGTVD